MGGGVVPNCCNYITTLTRSLQVGLKCPVDRHKTTRSGLIGGFRDPGVETAKLSTVLSTGWSASLWITTVGVSVSAPGTR